MNKSVFNYKQPVIRHTVKTLSLSIASFCLLASSHLFAQSNAQEAYDLGQAALNQKEWQKAADYFSTAAQTENANTDAALYWQAYALSKSGQEQRVQKPLTRLLQNYPDSVWHDDAEVLLFDTTKKTSDLDLEVIEANELRIYALSVLMEKDPERAIPKAEQLLKESKDRDSKEQILFLLSSNRHPRAKAIVRDIAFSASEPELQETAIYLTADSGSKEDLEALFKLYGDIESTDAKESIIYALGNNDALELLKQILATEKEPDLQASIIYSFTNMGATDELLSLDMASLNRDAQEALIHAYAQNSTMDPRHLRELESIYESTNDQGLKETIIYAYSDDEHTDKLLNILKTETDPDLQAAAIYSLKGTHAKQALLELDIHQLKGDAREALIYTFAEMGEVEKLKGLLDDEQDSDIRTAILYSLANSEDPEASSTLINAYRNKDYSSEEREAALYALMHRNETQTLIKLLKEEKDPELKVMILRAVASSDDPSVQAALFEILEN